MFTSCITENPWWLEISCGSVVWLCGDEIKGKCIKKLKAVKLPQHIKMREQEVQFP